MKKRWFVLSIFLLSLVFVPVIFAADDTLPEPKIFNSAELFPSWRGALTQEDADKNMPEADKTIIQGERTKIKEWEKFLGEYEQELEKVQNEIQQYLLCKMEKNLSPAPDGTQILSGQCANWSPDPDAFFELQLSRTELHKKINQKKNEITEAQQLISKMYTDWQNAVQISGIVGAVGDGKLLMQYLPRVIDILLKFVAPLVLIMFLYSGVRFIYAGDDEEDLTQSKQFFMYSLMGVLFVILSYSIIKALYFILSTAS